MKNPMSFIEKPVPVTHVRWNIDKAFLASNPEQTSTSDQHDETGFYYSTGSQMLQY